MAKQETFPKVVFESNITKMVIDGDGAQLLFKNVNLTGSEIERLTQWLRDHDSHTRITIEQIQGSLDFEA